MILDEGFILKKETKIRHPQNSPKNEICKAMNYNFVKPVWKTRQKQFSRVTLLSYWISLISDVQFHSSSYFLSFLFFDLLPSLWKCHASQLYYLLVFKWTWQTKYCCNSWLTDKNRITENSASSSFHIKNVTFGMVWELRLYHQNITCENNYNNKGENHPKFVL